jgi:hypothetical protein
MKEFFSFIGLLAIFSVMAFFLFSIANYANEEERRVIQKCKSFGQDFEFSDGDRSPDICVNNKTGEVRYP